MKKKGWVSWWKEQGANQKERVVILFCVGIFLFMANGIFGKTDSSAENTEEETVTVMAQTGQEQALEERLEAVFSQVGGAGRVEVMVYFQTDGELVVAEEESSQTRGEDMEKTTQTVLMETGSGRQEPLVVQQKAPQVEGVLIVAQGGIDARVQQALIAGAQALLGVPAHKIAVFPMETAQ